MIRWVIFSVAIVAVAALATVGSIYLAPEDALEKPVPTAQEKPTGPTGEAVVDLPLVHDFGVMAQKSDGKRTWTVTNKGPGPIKLTPSSPSCSCMISELPVGKSLTLAAGESKGFTLKWNTKTFDHYSQHQALLVENDPSRQEIDLKVIGQIKPPLVAFPGERLDFQTVSNEVPQSREVSLISFDRPELKVTDVQTNNALFSTEVKPFTADDCKRFKVSGGSKVVVTIKPGASLGNFNEEMVVSTDHPLKPKVAFVVAGKLEGPISLTPERVRMIGVAPPNWGSQKMTIWVRGQKATHFTVEKKPEGIDVEIEPLGDVGASANATKYQMTVTVPPGTRLGRSIDDEIILKTDHPQAGQLKIPVSVFVRAS